MTQVGLFVWSLYMRYVMVTSGLYYPASQSCYRVVLFWNRRGCCGFRVVLQCWCPIEGCWASQMCSQHHTEVCCSCPRLILEVHENLRGCRKRYSSHWCSATWQFSLAISFLLYLSVCLLSWGRYAVAEKSFNGKWVECVPKTNLKFVVIGCR